MTSHIKSTGVRKNKNARENPTIYGRQHHIRHHLRLQASTFFNCAKKLQPYFKVAKCDMGLVFLHFSFFFQ